jgi:tripartite-type tricarboxylate transporter receptor subunit TctC
MTQGDTLHPNWSSKVATLCALLFISALLNTTGANADPVADFYKGKQIQMIVGHSPGGGYDIYARLLARYLGPYVPGNPTIVVQNMTGAASLVSANYVYGKAPKDGTVIGMIDRGLPLMSILGTNPNVRFDAAKFTWLGSTSSFADDAFLLIARKDAVVKTVEDARRPGGPKLIVGVTADGATDKDVAVLFRDVLGFNLKIIAGYRGGNEINLALDRGEVDARLTAMSGTSASRPAWFLPDSPMHVLVQFARATRHSRFPDIPTARELARDPTSLTLVELAELPYQMSRPFVAPPGIPPDRAKALEVAMINACKDANFLAEAASLKLDVSPIDGDAMLKLIERLAKSPPDVLEKMKALQSGQVAP